MTMPSAPSPSPAPNSAPRAFDLQGHRGARGLAPENTLAGFARALTLGVTTLELDLGLTRDGVVVVSHDAVLNPDHTRDASGGWLEAPGPAIFSLTFGELGRYDVGRLRPGTAYAARFPGQAAADGQRIPAFREVAALVRRAGNAHVRFNVETKLDPRFPARTPAPEAFAEAVVRVLREEGLTERAIVQSFDWRTLRHVRRLAPGISLSCLTLQQGEDDNVQLGRPGPSPWLDGLDADDFGGSVPRLVKAAGAEIWSPHFADLTPAAVREARQLGLTLLPWTANEPEHLEMLIDAGVDGIITDYPDRLRTALQRRGLSLPEPTPATP
jgi:glycerophosphoryl diester phosphodiesterase